MKPDNVIFIFDFDGVILDSVGLLYGVYLEFLKEFGIHGNKKEFNLLNGPKISEIVLFLKEKYGLEKGLKELSDIYYKKLSSAYEKARLNDGAEKILKLLKSKNIPVALASSSGKEEIEAVFKRFGLNDYFDFTVTGDDVKKAKPSPEIYNIVKEKYPGYEYYVIEDSENGVEAAISSGMKTIFYNPDNKNINQKVYYKINSLHRIKNIITEIKLNCFIVSKAEKIMLKLVNHKPDINISQKQTIEKIWNRELKNKKKLFDGKIVSYKSHKKKGDHLVIDCFITQYKYFLAQLKNPELRLNIRPIGVSGIIIDKDKNMLAGIRHNVSEYEDFYEFIPAGSIDPSNAIDDFILFAKQLTEEFEEETQIKKDKIEKIVPCCLIFDKNHGVYDICSKIYVKGLLCDLIKSGQNDEYKYIEIINLKKIHKKIKTHNFVPTSIVFWDNLT